MFQRNVSSPKMTAFCLVLASMLLTLTAPAAAQKATKEGIVFIEQLTDERAPQSARVWAFFHSLHKIREFDEQAFSNLLRFHLAVKPESPELEILTRSVARANQLANLRRNLASTVQGVKEIDVRKRVQRQAGTNYAHDLGSLFAGMVKALEARGVDGEKIRELVAQLSEGIRVGYTEPEELDIIEREEQIFERGKQQAESSLFADLPHVLQ